jgi:hypothetical protein
MPPTTVDTEVVSILIRAVATIGEEVAIAILGAIKGGDVNTVEQLSKQLPDAEQIRLRDEALIASQRAKAHVGESAPT